MEQKLTGANLLAKIEQVQQANPQLDSRQKLAELCGYGTLKRDLAEFNANYIDAAGVLPPIDDRSKYDISGRHRYQVNKGGIVCVRMNWLAKIGAKRGDTVAYSFNEATKKIELSLVAKAETPEPAISLAPVAPSAVLATA